MDKIENALRWLIVRELRLDMALWPTHAVSDEEIQQKADNVMNYGEPEPDTAKMLRADMARKDGNGSRT